MALLINVCVLLATFSYSFCWENGQHSQFLILNKDGGYKYGYDTGDLAAKQSGDSANQVAGHYFYKNNAGQNVALKYTAGVQGFVPEGLEKLQPLQYSSIGNTLNQQSSSGDSSYNFNIDTDTYKRQESSDAKGNIQGRYSYSNEAGTHDLSYVAGEGTGFVATSGSLSSANGLKEGQTLAARTLVPSSTLNSAPVIGQTNTDGSYAFAYSSGDSSRQESADAGNNVQGRYSYQNSAGSHDLSYVAGSQTGFLVTGGSLAKPNLPLQSPISTYSASLPVPIGTYSQLSQQGSEDDQANTGDSSYSFTIDTDEYKRQESSDANGKVVGSFSYKNAAGLNDLSYVAGSGTGFIATGGSLSDPNAITNKIASLPYSRLGVNSGFSRIQAPISTYSASALSVAPLVPTGTYSQLSQQGSEDDQANTGDSSYSFTIDTDEYKRQESSDSNGKVVGSFSYKNAAGLNDLSYVAGSGTGFVATGGSLSDPNAITNKIASLPYSRLGVNSGFSSVQAPISTYSASALPVAPLVPTGTYSQLSQQGSQDDEANTGDSSYSFTIDTDEYKRQESSDANGKVVGSFSYKNAAGLNDLSYVAGSGTGFVATGGSLSDPNAITNKIASLPYSRLGVNSGFSSVQAPISTYSASALPAHIGSYSSQDDQANTGDSSYSFTIDTDEYKRQESSDATGNVQGSYTYKNAAGSHDLAFVAGSNTGFLPTGGSLQIAPGLKNGQLVSLNSPQIYSVKSVFGSPTNALNGKLTVNNAYLPPSRK